MAQPHRDSTSDLRGYAPKCLRSARHRRAADVVVAVLALLLCGCPGKDYVRSYPPPSVDKAVAHLAQGRTRVHSFVAKSVMDYWVGDDRVKGEVWVMGTPGAQVRFNALSPAGGSPLVDLACDGRDFVYVNNQSNCMLTGPCNQDSIAQLLGVALAPDDFFYLALGQSPVIAYQKGTITWDSGRGAEKIELTGAAGSQILVLDGRSAHWDVLHSELRTRGGKIVWAVDNTDFAEVKSEDGQRMRVPGKTRFRSPDGKADLIVDWKSRRINEDIAPERFVREVPEGLPWCGQAAR